MNATRLVIICLALTVLFSLSGCGGRTLPPYIGLIVANEGVNQTNHACNEGMKVRLETGSLLFETPVLTESIIYRLDFPEDVSIGSPVLLEVWCYGTAQQQTGYIRVASPLQSASAVDMVVGTRDKGEDRAGCLEGAEEIEPVPCVTTRLL